MVILHCLLLSILLLPSHSSHYATSQSTLKLTHILHRSTSPENRIFKRFDINSTAHTFSDEFVHKVWHYPAPRIRPVYRTNSSNSYSRFVVRPDGDGTASILRVNENNPDLVWTHSEGDNIISPDPSDKETVLSMARMAANSYTEPSHADWMDLSPHYKTNISFGWDSDGIRGYVFSSESDDLMVIAIKGTSASFLGIGGGATGRNDKLNDNMMFSCCCARVDRTWRPVCDCFMGISGTCNGTCIRNNSDFEGSYYRASMDIYAAVVNLYPHATIWFTGHSLGGAISALLGLTFHLPALTYETPGEMLYAKRMNIPIPDNMSILSIYHFGHNADPVFLGSCRGPRSSCYFAGYAMETRCHVGHKCEYTVRQTVPPTSTPDNPDGDDENPPGEENPITSIDSEVAPSPTLKFIQNSNQKILRQRQMGLEQVYVVAEPTTSLPPTQTPQLNWKVDIRHHRIHDVINNVLIPWPGVAECKVQSSKCKDCLGWKYE